MWKVGGTYSQSEVQALSFNGATPLRVWKALKLLWLMHQDEELQRSHTFEGVEGTTPSCPSHPRSTASTEPHL